MSSSQSTLLIITAMACFLNSSAMVSSHLIITTNIISKHTHKYLIIIQLIGMYLIFEFQTKKDHQHI